MGRNWMFVTFCGFLLVAVVGFCCFWTYNRIDLRARQYRYRSTKYPTIISSSLRSSSPTRRARRMIFGLLCKVNLKEDEESGGAIKSSYELGRRDN